MNCLTFAGRNELKIPELRDKSKVERLWGSLSPPKNDSLEISIGAFDDRHRMKLTLNAMVVMEQGTYY